MGVEKNKGLVLFDDQPQQIDSAQDSARLGAAKGVLQHQIELALRENKSVRIGLFGALGQGKSSVLLSVESELETRYRVARFECSNHRQQQLEFEFDRMLASLSPGYKLANLAFWLAIAVFIVASFSMPANSTSFTWPLSKTLQVVSLLVAIFLLPSWKHLRRNLERAFNLYGIRWSGWYVIKKGLARFFTRPQVLLVDDLDRASLKQQRAVLRALAKVPRSPQVIVIALDETQLLNALPDPEAPAELLRKFINVECRLPQRLQEDHVYLSLVLLHEFCKNNSQASISSGLLEPQLVGDICRVVGWLPNPGPRRIRHLINDLALLAEQLQIYRPGDVAALLRILGLYELAPALRSIDERLIAALEECTSWEYFCQRCRLPLGQNYPKSNGDPNSDELKGIRSFYKLSRCMRPETISWAQLVGHQQDKEAVTPSTHNMPSVLEQESITKRLTEIRRLLLDAANGYTGARLTLEPFDQHCFWPMADVALAHTREPSQRQRLYLYLLDFINKSAGRNDWFYCLCRHWFSDSEVLDLCASDFLLALCQDIQKRFDVESLRLLLYLPGAQLSFQQRLALLGNSEQNKRELSLARRWLSDYSIDDHDGAEPFTSTYENLDLLQKCWPLPGNDGEYFSWHCRQFATLLDKKPDLALPNNLRALWFDNGWLAQFAADDLATTLNGLADLLSPFKYSASSWRLPYCLLTLAASSSYSELLEALIRRDKIWSSLNSRQINTILLMGCAKDAQLTFSVLKLINSGANKISLDLLRLLLADDKLRTTLFAALSNSLDLWQSTVLKPILAHPVGAETREECLALLEANIDKLPESVQENLLLTMVQ